MSFLRKLGKTIIILAIFLLYSQKSYSFNEFLSKESNSIFEEIKGFIQYSTAGIAFGATHSDAKSSINSISNTHGPSVIGRKTVPTLHLDSPLVPLGDMLNVGRTTFTSMVDGQPIVRISGAHRQANPPNEDWWTDPDGVVIGGFSEGRGSHMIITCQDEGGMNLGACLSIWNSNSSYTGNRPGISPTTGNQMASYGTFDSVVEDIGTKSSPPKLVFGSRISDETGTKRSIYFSSSGVFIYPTMDDKQRSKLKQHQNIISNVSMSSYVNRKNVYGAYAVNGFSGMLNNWSFSVPCPSKFQNSKFCDRLDVDMWVIPGAGNVAKGNPQNYALEPLYLDRHYDFSATTPTIYIGARSKQFNQLLTCELGDYDTVNNRGGAPHSLVRECENGEYDNELHTTTSGKYHFNGLTIGVDSHEKGLQWVDGTPQTDGYNAWPDKESWGIYLGGQIPKLLELNPFISSFVQSIAGNTINVTNPISTGSAPNSTALVMSLFKNAGSSSMILNQWQSCDAPSGAKCVDYRNMSWREGLRVGGTVGSLDNGIPGAYVKYSGDGSYSICNASNQCNMFSKLGYLFNNSKIITPLISVNNIVAKNKNIKLMDPLIVNKTLESIGMATFEAGVSLGAGKSISLTDIDADNNGRHSQVSFIYNKGWIIGSGQGETLKGLTVSSYRETLTSPTSSSSCKPGQFTDDTNYHYVCVATNKWRRVALSDY
ncbi:hypothetical protein [Gluconobacter sp. P1D12_c]|uniref:hypothetical protein n=1 Tax=Gluconobacter sp. P1D12_c TaxID=2762614 RepID=UPI001C05D941|nr:hypothetical protein [Gluconobacter sp. P1D12_c]